MGFTKKTPDSAFSNFLDETKQVVFRRAIKAFVYVGEACLSEARLNGNYIDRTGNLRNSIGYAVLFNGEVITSAELLANKLVPLIMKQLGFELK